MDRLCIIQTSAEDKDWHITGMHRIYSDCKLCIVVPGGMRHLVSLDKETFWIHRSWTLLEAIAPSEVMVLLQWTLGPGIGLSHSAVIEEVVPCKSMMMPLAPLLEVAAVGYMIFLPQSQDHPAQPITLQVSIFGTLPSRPSDGDIPFWRQQHKFVAPHVHALAMVLASRSSIEERGFTIWQSAFLRTCARPVDLVLSVMGLFGVSLDPSAFSEDDQRSALIALAREVLEAGGSASWLGAAARLEPDLYMSTFPTLPQASNAGAAFVRHRGRLCEVEEVVGPPVRFHDRATSFPRGCLDETGCLTFTARYIRLRSVDVDDWGPDPYATAVDHSRWVSTSESEEVHGSSSGGSPVYGAFLGAFEERSPGTTLALNRDVVRLMVLEETSPDYFFLRTYLCMSWNELENARAWPEREFCAGGLEPKTKTAIASGHQVLGHEVGRDYRTICAMLANSLPDRGLDITSSATPCRLRLIDCEAFTERGILRLLEFTDFPMVPYSAISYPWRGVPADTASVGPRFSVAGAEDADPVGIDVLQHACVASLIRNCPYLWMDRLCIMQTNRADRNWQIRHMYRVYKSCALCIVVPGGIQRLVRLNEETSWIYRSWTLQEALAPPAAIVLFSWELGWGETSVSRSPALVREVVPGQSAIAPLTAILEACAVGFLSFIPSAIGLPLHGVAELRVIASVFSSPESHSRPGSADAKAAPSRRLLSPNVVALSIAMDPILTVEPDVRAHAAWQSALMRTSSRPVDMVFSIMGLFGVTLDPSAFHKDDRRAATIALAQAILKSGQSASWLGAAFTLKPDRCLSTFPMFPRTSVSGMALVQTEFGGMREVSELVDHVGYPNSRILEPLPKGTMDDAGSFRFATHAIKIVAAEAGQSTVFEAVDRSRWTQDENSCSAESSLSVYAALLGFFDKYYPGVTPAYGKDNIRLMVLEEYRTGIFHLRTYFCMGVGDRDTVLGWPAREFCVGGRDTLGSLSPQLIAVHVPFSDEDIAIGTSSPIPRSGLTAMLEEETRLDAEGALPQRGLERLRRDVLQSHGDEFFVWTGPPSLD
ncbi:hypothetical protein K466DRAFT_257179 [Polyporus arcularius HHB13444]|uniref:Heterokaryon incompatibility domain-containing protein n=1 Tax=Polyporus arcularius HHB13444 TaxID=1314778 RepID=A0A5C3PU50_9APHY|nr:hypothetical protein K466DRAFT_257179 [Polyporus arcularius HHB13444]